MSTSPFMHMCLASVDHHLIISGRSISLKNPQQLLFTHLSHRNLIIVIHYCMACLNISYKDRSMYKLNSAARVVLQMSRFQHITSVLSELHWLPIQQLFSLETTLSFSY